MIELNCEESIFILRDIRFLKVTCWSFISSLLLQNIKNVFNIPKGRAKILDRKQNDLLHRIRQLLYMR